MDSFTNSKSLLLPINLLNLFIFNSFPDYALEAVYPVFTILLFVETGFASQSLLKLLLIPIDQTRLSDLFELYPNAELGSANLATFATNDVEYLSLSSSSRY